MISALCLSIWVRLRAAWVLVMLAITSGVSTAERIEWVTSEALAGMEAVERVAWESYLERSQAAAARDQAALASELKAAGLSGALAAPSGGDFKFRRGPGDDWFATEEAAELARAILSYQTPVGGWSKHTGYNKGPRRAGMLWSSQYQPGKSPHYLGTFDNDSTTAQLRFLACMWQATQRGEYAEAGRRGLDYILAAQFPNGGWPQGYPLEGGYHDGITLNDDAMTSVLELLHDISSGAEQFSFLGKDEVGKASQALQQGLSCLRAMQVELDGRPTVWCAQHHPLTLEPVAARAMEPASLGAVESANLLKFLMRLPDPDRDLIACIDHGLAWLEEAGVAGLTRGKRDGKTVYEADPESDAVFWARFYSLESGKPIFPGRDGVIYDSYAEMAVRNKLGYDYYSTRPGSVVRTQQKKWRKMLAEK